MYWETNWREKDEEQEKICPHHITIPSSDFTYLFQLVSISLLASYRHVKKKSWCKKSNWKEKDKQAVHRQKGKFFTA